MLDHLSSDGYFHAVSLVRHIEDLEKRLTIHDRLLVEYENVIRTNIRLEQKLKDTKERLAKLEKELDTMDLLIRTVWLSSNFISAFECRWVTFFLNLVNHSKRLFKIFPKK